MISKNTSLNTNDYNGNYETPMNIPFLLKPAGQDYLWGGNKLNEDFGKNINMTPLQKHGSAQSILMEKVLLPAVHASGRSYQRCLPTIQNIWELCSGALIAEIQQNSNVTYRLYDYKRVDKTGNKRELHISKALDAANFRAAPEPRQPLRVKKFKRGYATELLSRCKYFQVERMLLNTERVRTMAELQTGSNSFQALLCTDGCGIIYWEEGGMLNFYRGDCIFIPANSVELKLHGKAQLLLVGC